MVFKSVLPTHSRTSKKQKPTTAAQLMEYEDILKHGKVLCIDPSIGSRSSDCGYAIVSSGRLRDKGIIEVDKSGNHSQRLNELTQTLREEFEKPDILLIEKIAARGRGFNTNIALILHRAIGAVLSVWHLERVVEIPPQLWHAYTDRETYEKNDVNDAVMLWECARLIMKEENELRKKGK